MDSKKLCPLRKMTEYCNQNWGNGIAQMAGEEYFLPCIGDECAAYEERAIAGYCKMFNTCVAPAQSTKEIK